MGAALAVSFSIPPDSTADVLQLNFIHTVGVQPLTLDSVHYRNELNQEFTVSKFKYYISNIRLKGRSGNNFFLDRSFLIDEENEKSKLLPLYGVPPGSYESI